MYYYQFSSKGTVSVSETCETGSHKFGVGARGGGVICEINLYFYCSEGVVYTFVGWPKILLLRDCLIFQHTALPMEGKATLI